MQHERATTDKSPSGPLAGLRVIEMAGIGPCPFAAMLLSDMGAEVVRIVRPDSAATDARDSVLRGRRNIQLNLKSPENLSTLLTLVERTDILIEGFRPGVMERLGLGPAELFRRNSRLIYGRITGWGQGGPLAQTAGHDINYIALTGALAAIGTQDGCPVPPLNLVGDYGGGAMYLLVGILAALHERSHSGRGQVIDSAMVDGAASLMSALYAWKGMGMWPGARGNNLLDGGAPFYGTYRCADDKFVAIGCMEQKFFDVMLSLMGLSGPEFALRDDPAEWSRLRDVLSGAFRQRTRAEWCTLLEDSDACCVPILTMEEAMHHPHLAARHTFTQWNGLSIPAPAPRFSRTPSEIRDSTGVAREDASSVLRDWVDT
jgi:alpha-methylacyl-CoA racemase